MAKDDIVPPWQRKPYERLKPVKPAQSATGGGARPYGLGYRFEYAIKQQLERRGYYVVRSHGSKGEIDMVAIGKDRPVLFIQAKRMGKISSQEWNAVYDVAMTAGAWPVLVMRESARTTSYFRMDDRKEPRKKAWPMTRFDPKDCSLLLPPPKLL
jgi:Holliday junction resolvase